jgi:hypothetical protein
MPHLARAVLGAGEAVGSRQAEVVLAVGGDDGVCEGAEEGGDTGGKAATKDCVSQQQRLFTCRPRDLRSPRCHPCASSPPPPPPPVGAPTLDAGRVGLDRGDEAAKLVGQVPAGGVRDVERRRARRDDLGRVRWRSSGGWRTFRGCCCTARTRRRLAETTTRPAAASRSQPHPLLYPRALPTPLHSPLRRQPPYPSPHLAQDAVQELGVGAPRVLGGELDVVAAQRLEVLHRGDGRLDNLWWGGGRLEGASALGRQRRLLPGRQQARAPARRPRRPRGLRLPLLPLPLPPAARLPPKTAPKPPQPPPPTHTWSGVMRSLCSMWIWEVAMNVCTRGRFAWRTASQARSRSGNLVRERPQITGT